MPTENPDSLDAFSGEVPLRQRHGILRLRCELWNMRHLLACLAILVAFNVTAQATIVWNPDANGDGIVGASDLLPFLEAEALDSIQ